jgi:hypothetical protein
VVGRNTGANDHAVGTSSSGAVWNSISGRIGNLTTAQGWFSSVGGFFLIYFLFL